METSGCNVTDALQHWYCVRQIFCSSTIRYPTRLDYTYKHIFFRHAQPLLLSQRERQFTGCVPSFLIVLRIDWKI
jgi:hypothetical protein